MVHGGARVQNVTVFEPNTHVDRCFVLPAAAAEILYRTTNDTIDYLTITNANPKIPEVRPCVCLGVCVCVCVGGGGVLLTLLAKPTRRHSPSPPRHLPHAFALPQVSNYLRNALSLHPSRTALHGRFKTPWVLSAFTDAVISHQWGNPASYLLLDVMHAGFPLVHNSPYFKVATQNTGGGKETV